MIAQLRRIQHEFRHVFAYGSGGETLRAFALFTVMLALLVGIGSHMAFRELSLSVLTERLDIGRTAAERIAAEVEALGDTGNGIDFSRVRANETALQQFIDQRISDRVFISHVEIRDRFGALQITVPRRSEVPGAPAPESDRDLPDDWPGIHEVRVPLRERGTRLAEGEIRVGMVQGPMLDDVNRLRTSLKTRLFIAGAAAIAVLVAGLFYVLHLLRKNRRLEQARQSADRASYVGLLASGLAHEIRNPLNAMSMNLQMLEEELHGVDGADATDHAELLESTKSEIKRLERLVNNFLTFARPSRPRFEKRDLNAVVEDVLRFLEADFRLSGVNVMTNLAQLLPTTELDETLFRQALINLLVNARQVLKHGGTVRVITRAGSSGDVVLEVADDGPGIPAEIRERIFEVFFSSRGGGTGLGLPIARQIVERHGGKIEVETAEGQGTTFRIRLPRRHEPAGTPIAPAPAEGRP